MNITMPNLLFTRIVLALLICLTAMSGHAQVKKIKSDLAKINSINQANTYIANHPTLVAQVFDANAETDTTDFDKKLLSSAVGDIIDFDSEDEKKHLFFKVLSTGEAKSYRVQYIFLDNKKLSMAQIRDLRQTLVERLKNGESFTKLAAEHSMDGNAKRGGDLGWFPEGRMHAKFEESVKQKTTGEIYTVDIPSESWYYIVKNTHDPKIGKKVTVLYVEASN